MIQFALSGLRQKLKRTDIGTGMPYWTIPDRLERRNEWIVAVGTHCLNLSDDEQPGGPLVRSMRHTSPLRDVDDIARPHLTAIAWSRRCAGVSSSTAFSKFLENVSAARSQLGWTGPANSEIWYRGQCANRSLLPSLFRGFPNPND